MPVHQSPTQLEKMLLLRFCAYGALGDVEREKLRNCAARAQHSWPAGQRLSQGSDGSSTRLIVSGWAGAVRVLSDGRRQIVNVFLPGDVIGLADPDGPLPAINILALSQLRTVQASELQRGRLDPSREPGLAAALTRMAAEHDYYLMGQIVRLGRQNAYERIANWLTEIDLRLSASGLSDHGSFNFPLTQETISDVAGLSVVHVNRTLQEMRRQGYIELKSGRMKLLNRDALANAGEFMPPRFPSDMQNQFGAAQPGLETPHARAPAPYAAPAPAPA